MADADFSISFLKTQVSAISQGGQIGFYSGDVKELLNDIQYLRPTYFASVPRLLNRIYDRVCD